MIAELLPFVNTFFRFPARRRGKRAEMRFHSRCKRPSRRIQGPQPPNEKRPRPPDAKRPRLFSAGALELEGNRGGAGVICGARYCG